MKVIWFEQDCSHEDPEELAGCEFDSVTEDVIKNFCDDTDYSYTVYTEYADDNVKIFQAIEDDGGESFKFIIIK